MYGKLSKRKGKKRGFTENLLAFGLAFLTLIIWIEIQRRGLDQKWSTAVAGTIIPFGLVLYGYRQVLNRRSFWGAFSVCLVCHAFLIWFVFGVVLSDVERFSVLFWLPVLLLELFALLIVIAKVHNRLFGNKESITLRF